MWKVKYQYGSLVIESISWTEISQNVWWLNIVCNKCVTDLFEKVTISIYCTWDEHCVLGDLVHPCHCFSFVILLGCAEGEIEKLWNESFTWCLGKDNDRSDVNQREWERGVELWTEVTARKRTNGALSCQGCARMNGQVRTSMVCTHERMSKGMGCRECCIVCSPNAMLSSSYQIRQIIMLNSPLQ